MIGKGKMRIKKKLVELAGTKAVILPKAWYVELKRRYGKELKMVYLDINDEEIRIIPVWEES